MSDWEELCESHGWNISSADDFELFLDSLESKPEESTTTILDFSSINEYESDATIEEVMADLEGHVLGNEPLDLIHKPWGWKPHRYSTIPETCLDGITYDHYNLHSFTIQARSKARGEYQISLRLFIDAIRKLGIPVEVLDSVVAWENSAQCLDVCGGLLEKYENNKKLKPTETPSKENLKLLNFLERSRSTEHGFKPAIISTDEVAQLNRCGNVTFLDPTTMTTNDLNDCALAYFNKEGKPKWIPMDYIISTTSLLTTRIGSYLIDEDKIRPINGAATMLANAYSISKKQGKFGASPILQASYFILKEGGTIFEPAYRQISESQARKTPPKRVYITDGSHPLENCHTHRNGGFVTTYAHYEDARAKLKSYWATY